MEIKESKVPGFEIRRLCILLFFLCDSEIKASKSMNLFCFAKDLTINFNLLATSCFGDFYCDSFFFF